MKFFTNMFEAWFKRKFDTKCKQNIDLILMRIEIIKRRRNAMQKYLRSDIAELIKIGHDSEAYRRVGRLYLDQIRSLCYDFVGRYCTLVLEQLTTMNDQSECPEECKEAISSLIYAAARFADLPELRKLRTLFFERYGNSIESFVNKEFVDLLKPDRPTQEMKVQLMQEIAQEHGVNWDPESLDNRLYIPYSSQRDRFENIGADQDNESHTTAHENGWMINIQKTINDDSNAHVKDETNDDVKQIEILRQRIMDYWSRTSSLLSTSRETNTSREESSTSSDESTKSRPFNFRLMPPPYVKNDPNKTRTNLDTVFDCPTNNESNANEDVSNHANVENLDDEKSVAASRPTKNRWWRKSGALPRAKLHPAEDLSNSTTVEEPKDLSGHVHPKLPDYDKIKAQFAAIRTKS